MDLCSYAKLGACSHTALLIDGEKISRCFSYLTGAYAKQISNRKGQNISKLNYLSEKVVTGVCSCVHIDMKGGGGMAVSSLKLYFII